MLPRADRSAISCIKSSNSLIRASLRVNSGTVLLSCFNIVASSDLLCLVKVRGQTETMFILNAQVCFIVYKAMASPFYLAGLAQPPQPGPTPPATASMCRAQRSYNHRHHAQGEGYVK